MDYDDLIMCLRMKANLERLNGVEKPIEDRAIKAIKELVQMHQADLAQIIFQRRQIDFLMEGKENEKNH